ncbi:unnamed protein product [Linum trigynum]|uniref:F-box domain-containing protein n=1 Tax=Linum trigynum TaxID=586398 RepID=A0AAV2DIK1_9ROSI
MINQRIPEELIIEILWRLPTGGECIGRLRCVCKSWRAILSDPSFILRQQKSADSRHLQIMLNFRDENGRSVYSFHSADTLEPLLPAASPVQLLPFNPENPLKDDYHYHDRVIEVAGYCNGLICISDGDYDLILWNPATSETKVLSLPRNRRYRAELHAVGFGFDSKSNDYKIVRQLDYSDGSWGYNYTAEVYSLRTDSWTKIADREDGYNPVLPSRRITQLHKGKLYWMMGHGEGLLFDSFDLSSHEFRTVDLPRPSSQDVYIQRECSCLLNEESMVAFFPLYDDDDKMRRKNPRSWEMWVLLKYWVSESWTKVQVIASGALAATIPYSIGISSNLKCLVMVICDGTSTTKCYDTYRFGENDISCMVFHSEKGKFGDLEIKARNIPLMINYVPSEVRIRDY